VLAVRSRIPLIAMAITLVTGLLLLGSTAFAADPPGNNGTVKVDDMPFDNDPNNEPHVDCVFQVDFYGFDEGDVAQVTFTAHPPTSDVSGPGQVILQDSGIDVGGDDNSGGGSEAGLDASRTYTLDFSGTTIEPSEQQGFHVKLEVIVTSPNSKNPVVFKKHKVFWVQPCEEETTTTKPGETTTSKPGETTTTKPGETTTTKPGETTTTAPGGASSSMAPSSSAGGGVGGGAASSQPSGGAGVSGLAFTGANSLPLLVAAMALLGLGAITVLASRRRHGGAR
jgi:hypothetical protein